MSSFFTKPTRLTGEELCQHLEYELPLQGELIDAVNQAYWECGVTVEIPEKLKLALHALGREGNRMAILTTAIKNRIVVKNGP